MIPSRARLLSISSCCLLKPAWAANEIRAWRGSLATWPKKQRWFICAAAAEQTWKSRERGLGAQGGREAAEVKGQTGAVQSLHKRVYKATVCVPGLNCRGQKTHRIADTDPQKHRGMHALSQKHRHTGCSDWKVRFNFMCIQTLFTSSSSSSMNTTFASISGLIHPN